MNPHSEDAKSGRLYVAYCYPSPYWHMGEGDWVTVADHCSSARSRSCMPDYMYGRSRIWPFRCWLSRLSDQSLLEVLEATHWIDR